MKLTKTLPLMAALAALLAGCADESADAAGLLRASMDRYRSLKTLQADCTRTATVSSPGQADQEQTTKRTFAYAAPNKFRVTTTIQDRTVTSVSDGTTHLQLLPGANRKYQTPSTIAHVSTPEMNLPPLFGTLLYKFFEGADGLADLAKGDVTFAPEETVDGVKVKVVRFTSAQQYGTTEVGIDPATKLVRFIRCQNEPIMEQGKLQGKSFSRYVTTERYTNLRADEPIAEGLFATTLPPGEKLIEVPGASEQPGPETGKPAPDFTVVSTDGKQTKLSSLKGSVVFVDMWATWCGPCVRSLPHTQELYDRYGKKGLRVLAISDEEQGLVERFIAEHKFTFPVYLDKGATVKIAYNVPAIPAFLIIDRNGILVDYIVGGGQDDKILAALQKAGLKV